MNLNIELSDSLDNKINNFLFVIVLIVATSYVLSGYPFSYLFDDSVLLRSAFRISFGLILLLSLIRTRDALPLLFGHEAVLQNKSFLNLAKYYVQFPLILLLIVGLFTDVVAILLLVSRTIFNEGSNRYGLESTVYQMVLVHLPFLGSGARFSVDAVLGISPLLASPIMFNSLFILTAVMFFPGFYHKLKSRFWREGVAVRRFLNLPNNRGKPFRGWEIPLNKHVSAAMSYTMIFAQFSMLFSPVNKYYLLLIFGIFILFSVSLFSVVDLSFIGQVLLVIILLYAGSVIINFENYPPITLLFDVSLTLFTALSLIIIILAALTTLKFELVADTPLRTASRILSGQNATVMPFNEQHTEGIYVFQLMYEDDNTVKKEPVLEVYDEDGWNTNFFYPQYYEVSSLVVADYCLSVQEESDIRPVKRKDMIDLCAAGLYSINKTSGTVHLQIKIFDGDLEDYLKQSWKTLGTCRFENGEAEWELVETPPEYEDHPRLSFDDRLKTGG